MRMTVLIFALLLSLAIYSQETGSEQSETFSIIDTTGLIMDSSVGQVPHYKMDEVVTTGTRYEKKIIEIPYPVTRVDNRQFRYVRKVGTNDVINDVPGLFLQSRYGNHDVRVSIRGFGSRSNSGIRGVRILLDGISESEPDGQTRIEAIDFNAVGRIEVVKGNASSLYPNSPGGVINFINDIYFPRSFVTAFSDLGSYGLNRSGLKAGVRTANQALLFTYSNHQFEGYREHSTDDWHIINTVYDTYPNERVNLQVLGYFVDGEIRVPGSLTREQIEADPTQSAELELLNDYRRLSRKGRLGVRVNLDLDSEKRNQIELTSYGTIKYFERPSSSFRIINRYGLGSQLRYLNQSTIAGYRNEFSVGGDAFLQTGPVEKYNNIGGIKDDVLRSLTMKTIANLGAFFQNAVQLMDDKLSVLATGRYEKIVYDEKDRTLGSRDKRLRFESFTPKFGASYKLTPHTAIYANFGNSFEAPASNELDNHPLTSEPGALLNPDITAQKSLLMETGVKGQILRNETTLIRDITFELTVFNYNIDDEIVPAFEYFGDVFFRNAGQSNRKGLEFGSSLEIINGLHLKTAYTFSDFTYDEFSREQIVIENGLIDTLLIDNAGNSIPSVPRHNLNVSLTYEKQIKPGMTAFFKSTSWSVSGMFTDDENSDKSDDYRVLDTSFGLDFVVGHYNILFAAGVNNVLDEEYIGFININSGTLQFFEPGMPRNYFTSLKLGFTP